MQIEEQPLQKHKKQSSTLYSHSNGITAHPMESRLTKAWIMRNMDMVHRSKQQHHQAFILKDQHHQSLTLQRLVTSDNTCLKF